jgi:hypothetical protein
MDPLITNRIDAALPSASGKRGNERAPVPRRSRPAVPENTVEEEQLEPDPDSDTPKHALDDLA